MDSSVANVLVKDVNILTHNDDMTNSAYIKTWIGVPTLQTSYESAGLPNGGGWGVVENIVFENFNVQGAGIGLLSLSLSIFNLLASYLMLLIFLMLYCLVKCAGIKLKLELPFPLQQASNQTFHLTPNNFQNLTKIYSRSRHKPRIRREFHRHPRHLQNASPKHSIRKLDRLGPTLLLNSHPTNGSDELFYSLPLSRHYPPECEFGIWGGGGGNGTDWDLSVYKTWWCVGFEWDWVLV